MWLVLYPVSALEAASPGEAGGGDTRPLQLRSYSDNQSWNQVNIDELNK